MTHFLRRIPVTYLLFLPLIICVCLAVSCKKPIDDNVKLHFSYFNDDKEHLTGTKLTVTFDTVFTSIGSVTRHFIVRNTSNNDIKTTIYLAGGKQSFYSINVNGVPETFFENVEIPKKDSIFIFVKVNIDPQNQNNPFLVTDSIVFLTGTQKQDVKLLAYGQDARYIIADTETGYKIVAGERQRVTWTKDRPYVVYGWAVIDSAGRLTIEPGTKIYFHHNSGLWAYRYSNLQVNGTLEEPVIFRGDRLEKWFDDDYAQWNRIWINEGVNANINNAIITHACVGVQVDPLPIGNSINITPNIVNIENTIIRNTKLIGVLSRFLNLEMTNCVITNNEGCSLQLEGGQYTMKHLTIANYAKVERKTPACYVSNKVSDDMYKEVPPMDTKADFYNCIIYGKNETEAAASKAPGAELETTFQNCLVKAKDNASYFNDCLRNEDPKFTDKDKLDFTLLPESPAIGKGKPNIGVDEDILGKPRGNKPDIGAYQFGR